jgi:hypothetical protein
VIQGVCNLATGACSLVLNNEAPKIDLTFDKGTVLVSRNGGAQRGPPPVKKQQNTTAPDFFSTVPDGFFQWAIFALFALTILVFICVLYWFTRWTLRSWSRRKEPRRPTTTTTTIPTEATPKEPKEEEEAAAEEETPEPPAPTPASPPPAQSSLSQRSAAVFDKF